MPLIYFSSHTYRTPFDHTHLFCPILLDILDCVLVPRFAYFQLLQSERLHVSSIMLLVLLSLKATMDSYLFVSNGDLQKNPP